MKKDTIKVCFVTPEGEKINLEAPIGSNAMEFAQENNIDIPGMCGGSLACSTCNVVIDEKNFEKLDKASLEEEDMLDNVFDLKPTSRLSCQIIFTKDIDGITLYIPKN